MEHISLRCRSCNGHTIFIGKGGHLTCSYVDCKEPSVERQFVQLEAGLKYSKDAHSVLLERYDKLKAENLAVYKEIDRLDALKEGD